MSSRTKILIVEDSPTLQTLYAAYLEPLDYDLLQAFDLASASKLLAKDSIDLVLVDIELPDGSGIELIEPGSDCATPMFIAMTGQNEESYPIQATERGAVDFLSKPFDASRLRVTLENACERINLQQQLKRLVELEQSGYEKFIGSSLAMQAVYKKIESLSASNATCFLTGESGTGKELAAEALHERSARSQESFVAINCAAIPSELIESELFGHVKGAFTGSVSDRPGAVYQAHGGTLFLDEVCEMNLDTQKKLLRFIQTGTFRKVGSDKVEKVDVRFISATNRDPIAEVNEGRFREDLFYRLHVIPLRLPPLRERGDDILGLAKHFLAQFSANEGKKFSRISDETVECLRRHPWPGNVRQLQNVINHGVVLYDSDELTPEMLPEEIATGQLHVNRSKQRALQWPNSDNNFNKTIRPLRIIEREIIEEAIAACDGNVCRAAVLLEISPSTVYRKMENWSKRSN